MLCASRSMAKRYIREIQERGHIPILVGGTGFYIQSVLYDIDFTENGSDHSYREELETLAEGTRGRVFTYDACFKWIRHQRRQFMRTMSNGSSGRWSFTGRPGSEISEHNEEERRKASPYQFAYFVLNDARDRIYANIDCRVDLMLEHGLAGRGTAICRAQGCTRDMVSMQGLGYKEILDYLDGRCSYAGSCPCY